jgi:hypothetical protein
MPGDFERDDLETIVRLSGQLLEFEDRFVCGCLERNPAYRGQVPGITFFQSERYYQMLTVRALLPSFRFLVRAEYDRFDIALFREVGESPVALGEMKLWMSATGESEIPAIKQDIEKLSKRPCAGFLMIFTMSPPRETARNVEWLAAQLPSVSESPFVYKFGSVYDDGKGNCPEGEFAVVGIMLVRGTLEALNELSG